MNAFQVAALRAIDAGRVPAEEAMVAKLKRLGLIARGPLTPRELYLTSIGQAAIADADEAR